MLTQTIILVFAFALRASCSIIEWAPCNDDEFNTTLPVQCGSLPVPLDYTQASGETITLEVIRIPASIQPSKGSILFNFGGPGLPARDDLVTLGPVLQQYVTPSGIRRCAPYCFSSLTSVIQPKAQWWCIQSYCI